jgi:hypothetical protein
MALAAVGCCLAAAAYAATRPQATGDGSGIWRPLQPRLTEYPDEVSTATTAEFAFAQPPRPPTRARPGGSPLRFECRLDRDEWEPCRSSLELRDLRPGRHRFEVRAVNSHERRGPAADREWRIVRRLSAAPLPAPAPVPAEPTPEDPTPPEGEAFSIEPRLSGLAPLFPGAQAQALPLALTNPSPETIFVTSLTVSVGADPAGCDSATNFELTPATASAATPLEIPAGATVTLPAQGIAAPAIAMRELPFSQDACQGAELPLRFSGEAHG